MKVLWKLAVIIGGIFLIFGGVLYAEGSSKAKDAEQYALDNSADSYAELLDVELDDEYDPDPAPADGSGEKTAGVFLGGLGLLGLAGGGYALKRPTRPGALRASLARPAQTPASAPADVERQPCPDCGELVAVTAKLCRFCRADLS